MALEFDGSTQYIDCGNGSSLQITGDVSVSAWLMVEQDWVPSNQQYHAIAIKGSIMNLGYGLCVYERNADSKTHPQFFVRNASGSSNTEVTYYVANDWGKNSWVHLIGTFNDTENRIRLYEAGTNVVDLSATYAPGATTDHFYLARPADSYATTDKFFKGHLADVRVYNRELTPEEAAEIYHKRGADRVWQGIVGWWKLDELTSGTPAPLLLDAMDATSGYTTSSGDSISLNTTTYQEGTGAINLIKGNATRTYAFFRKSIAATDVSDQTIKLWVYIKDSTTLNKIDYIDMRLYDSAFSNGKRASFSTGLTTGWNLLSMHIDDFTESGSFDPPIAENVYYTLSLNNNADTTSKGDVIFDFYRAGDYVPNSIIDLSGNGNHGTPYGGIYRDSPHRLRRGVLIS